MSSSSRFIRFRELVAAIGNRFRSVALLLIRLAWGWELAETGWGHLHHVAEMVKRFEGWHVPFPTPSVYISGTTELVGGVLLMLGLFARIISIPLFFNFCVAYATASHEKLVALLHFQSPDDVIDDNAFPFLVLCLIIFAFGPGRISLDALLFKKKASET